MRVLVFLSFFSLAACASLFADGHDVPGAEARVCKSIPESHEQLPENLRSIDFTVADPSGLSVLMAAEMRLLGAGEVTSHEILPTVLSYTGVRPG